jgi:hypothetical protein
VPFTVALPDPSLSDLTLEPTPESVRGLRGAEDTKRLAEALGPLRRRLSLGGPATRRIDTGSTDDVELQRFLKDQGANYDYYLLRLDCSVRHDHEEPFASALVAVDLSGRDPAEPTPIAWSIDPIRLFDPVQVSRTVSLGPSLKIVAAGLLDVGLQAKAETHEQHERKEIILEGLYELESTPTWTMFKTGSTELRGLYRFHLVVRSPKGATTIGVVTASATVERKRFGLIAYHAALPGRQEPIAFEISPSTTEQVRLDGSGI